MRRPALARAGFEHFSKATQPALLMLEIEVPYCGRACLLRHQAHFDFVEVRYRGLEKNAQWLFAVCAFIKFLWCEDLAALTTGVVCPGAREGA